MDAPFRAPGEVPPLHAIESGHEDPTTKDRYARAWVDIRRSRRALLASFAVYPLSFVALALTSLALRFSSAVLFAVMVPIWIVFVLVAFAARGAPCPR